MRIKREENEQDRDIIRREVKSTRNRRLRATGGKNKMEEWRRKWVSIIFITSSSPQCRLCSKNSEQTTDCFLMTMALKGVHTLSRKRLTGMHPIIFHARDHFKLQADFIQSGSAKMICACGRVTSTLLVAAWVKIRSHYSRLAEHLNQHVLHEDDRHFLSQSSQMTGYLWQRQQIRKSNSTKRKFNCVSYQDEGTITLEAEAWCFQYFS